MSLSNKSAVTSSVLVSKLVTDNKDDNGSTVVKNAMIEFDLNNSDENDIEENSNGKDEVGDLKCDTENEHKKEIDDDIEDDEDDDWDDIAW